MLGHQHWLQDFLSIKYFDYDSTDQTTFPKWRTRSCEIFEYALNEQTSIFKVAIETPQNLATLHVSSSLDKMAAILADNIFKCIFLNENDRILIKISLKFVPRSPIDNKPAMVQVIWLGAEQAPSH